MWSYNCFQTDCLWKIFLILMQFLGELKEKKMVPLELFWVFTCTWAFFSIKRWIFPPVWGGWTPRSRKWKKTPEEKLRSWHSYIKCKPWQEGGNDWQVGVLRKIPWWSFFPLTVRLHWKHNVGSFIMKRKERELLFAYWRSKNTLDTESLLNGCFALVCFVLHVRVFLKVPTS